MEYLIVFSVAAMMIAYAWIIGRCATERITGINGAAGVNRPRRQHRRRNPQRLAPASVAPELSR